MSLALDNPIPGFPVSENVHTWVPAIELRWEGGSYGRHVFKSVTFHLVKNHNRVCDGKARDITSMLINRKSFSYGPIHAIEHYADKQVRKRDHMK